MLKRVFIAHQLSGDLKPNLASAILWCRWAIIVKNVNPIAPYLSLMRILDESVEWERETGLLLGDEYIPMCTEFWMCGPVPHQESHVWEELKIAKKHNVTVVDYTGLTLPFAFHRVKKTTGPPALLVDKSNLVSPEG